MRREDLRAVLVGAAGVEGVSFGSSSSSGMPRMYQIIATKRTATTMKKRVLEVDVLKSELGVGVGSRVGRGVAVGVGVAAVLTGAARTDVGDRRASPTEKSVTTFFMQS